MCLHKLWKIVRISGCDLFLYFRWDFGLCVTEVKGLGVRVHSVKRRAKKGFEKIYKNFPQTQKLMTLTTLKKKDT